MKARYAPRAIFTVVAAVSLCSGAVAQTAPDAVPTMGSAMPTALPAPLQTPASVKQAARMADPFVTQAGDQGLTDAAAGQLALTLGSSPEVRAYGQHLISDHNMLLVPLQDLAAKKQVTLPTAPDASHQAMLNELKGKRGATFDLFFINDMKKSQAEALQLFKAASQNRDPDIAQFAGTAMPTFVEHEKTIPTL